MGAELKTKQKKTATYILYPLLQKLFHLHDALTMLSLGFAEMLSMI